MRRAVARLYDQKPIPAAVPRPARFTFLALLLCAAAFQPAAAQPVSAPPRSGGGLDTLSSAAEISMVTIKPGEAVYSVFGHSALRVRDPAQSIDVAYNYGTFDFSDPYFVPKFVYGRLDYFLSDVPYPALMRHYQAEGRSVIEQRLDLTAAEKDAVFRFLQLNALPQNRGYAYDFFFDNCSTRIRDVLEETLGERLRFDSSAVPRRSFRQLIEPYGGAWLTLGMNLLLGIPADRAATPRETMFLPDYLMDAFGAATVARGNAQQPLVARTDTTYRAPGPATALQEASFLTWPVLLGWFFFALVLAATLWEARHGSSGRRLPDALLLFVVGLAGLVVGFMTFFSQHAVTAYNMNVLWAWPTHLFAAAVLLRGRHDQALRRYLMAAALVALALAVGWPVWPQALPPAVFPVLLLLALRFGWQMRQLRTKRAATPVRA